MNIIEPVNCIFVFVVQRAEHLDAIHRLTQTDSPHTSEPSSVTSSMPTSEYSENHENLRLQTSKTNFSVKT